MASYVEGKGFVSAEPTDYEGYPDWQLVDCGCCAGIRWGGFEPLECRDCGGGGTLARHRKSGVLAWYPGGPLVGRDYAYLKAVAERSEAPK